MFDLCLLDEGAFALKTHRIYSPFHLPISVGEPGANCTLRTNDDKRADLSDENAKQGDRAT